jgi:hypothetical protein
MRPPSDWRSSPRGRPVITWGGVLLVAAGFLGLPRSAHAYLDPASGSLLLQVLLGGIAGAALALKLFWHRIAGLFSRKSRTDEPAD